MTVNRAKLGHLIRMLASPSDGEVVAAARALDRTLRSNHLDFHDLAEFLERGADTAAQFVDRPPDKPPRTRAPKSWQALARECLTRADDTLSTREWRFLGNMAGLSAPPSPKQSKWLSDIADRLGIAEGAAE